MSAADLLAFELELDGRPAHIELELATWSLIAGMAIKPERAKPQHLARLLESNVSAAVSTIDGARPRRARWQQLRTDSLFIAAVLARRYDVYQQIRAAGRMYAQCPHCVEGEIEMSLLGLFDTMGVMPPDMISADFAYFLPPVSDGSRRGPRRPANHAYAPRIRFALPTKLLGLPRKLPVGLSFDELRESFEGGVLRRANPWLAEPLYQAWETDGVNVPVEKSWHHRQDPAFRTTMWLMAALESVVPPVEVTLDAFSQLPAVDVYFLDAVYHLAFDTDVPEHALARTCPHCGGLFVPVAELVHVHG